MKYQNTHSIHGYVGQDAKTTKFENDRQVTNFSVATKTFWRENGEDKSRTEWHRVVTFGKLAEYARTLAKGSHLMVQGAVRSREYQRDGVKHRVFELRADTIAKLDRAERRHEGDVEPDASES